MGAIKVKKYNQVKQQEMEYKVKYYEKLLKQNNIVLYNPEGEYPDFDLACEKFRTTCSKISVILGEPFNGSYDDIEKHKDDSNTQTPEMQKLRDELDLYNNLCIHEGNKIGLPPPYWFFKCWGIEPPTEE